MAIPDDRDQVWKIVSQGELLWRFWDGEAVVHDKRNDNVHHLEMTSAAVFELLLSTPSSSRDLVQAMSERLQVVPNAEIERMVDEILRTLETKHIAAPIG
jgi:hypothetical protein